MTQAEKETIISLRQQQFSFSAIAEATGISLGTIKSFLSRTKRKDAILAAMQQPNAIQQKCRQCGAPLTQTEHRKIQVYCNDKCRARWWNVHRDLSKRISTHKQICEICGLAFYTYNGRYCSRTCFGLSRSTKAGTRHD